MARFNSFLLAIASAAAPAAALIISGLILPGLLLRPAR